MKYCVKCGNQLSDTDSFCAKCGGNQNEGKSNIGSTSNNEIKANANSNSILSSFNSSKTQEMLYKKVQTFYSVLMFGAIIVFLATSFIYLTTDNYRMANHLDTYFPLIIFFCLVFAALGIFGSLKMTKIKSNQTDENVQFTSTGIFGSASGKDFKFNYTDIISVEITEGNRYLYADPPTILYIKTKSTTYNSDITFKLFSKVECEEIKMRINNQQ